MGRVDASIALMLLAACSTEMSAQQVTDKSSAWPQTVTGPHGEPLLQVKCPEPLGCMAKAREVCHGNFDVVVSSISTTPSVASTAAMLVRCLTADGGTSPMPPAPDGGSWRGG